MKTRLYTALLVTRPIVPEFLSCLEFDPHPWGGGEGACGAYLHLNQQSANRGGGGGISSEWQFYGGGMQVIGILVQYIKRSSFTILGLAGLCQAVGLMHCTVDWPTSGRVY
jgi:hypothetical protein